jgi:hypothetical protein
MPRFDGTGPQGFGPVSGCGEGYCILELREPGQPARGYAGLIGMPVHVPGGRVRVEAPALWPARWSRTTPWLAPSFVRRRSWARRRFLRRR